MADDELREDGEALRKYFGYTDMKREGRTMSIEDEADMEACERRVLLRGLLREDGELPVIHLLRANGDLLPEIEGDTVTFERDHFRVFSAEACASVCGSLAFSRRTDITAEQAAPVLDEFIADVRAWFAESFRLEPARAGVS